MPAKKKSKTKKKTRTYKCRACGHRSNSFKAMGAHARKCSKLRGKIKKTVRKATTLTPEGRAAAAKTGAMFL